MSVVEDDGTKGNSDWNDHQTIHDSVHNLSQIYILVSWSEKEQQEYEQV